MSGLCQENTEKTAKMMQAAAVPKKAVINHGLMTTTLMEFELGQLKTAAEAAHGRSPKRARTPGLEDVYRLSIGYAAWVYEKARSLTGVHRPARDQWLRASQSIPLNIAEGNGKVAAADRRRYFEIVRRSVFKCAAIQDVLVVGQVLNERESDERKVALDPMAAMLRRLGGRGYCIEDSSTDLWRFGCRFRFRYRSRFR